MDFETAPESVQWALHFEQRVSSGTGQVKHSVYWTVVTAGRRPTSYNLTLVAERLAIMGESKEGGGSIMMASQPNIFVGFSWTLGKLLV